MCRAINNSCDARRHACHSAPRAAPQRARAPLDVPRDPLVAHPTRAATHCETSLLRSTLSSSSARIPTSISTIDYLLLEIIVLVKYYCIYMYTVRIQYTLQCTAGRQALVTMPSARLSRTNTSEQNVKYAERQQKTCGALPHASTGCALPSRQCGVLSPHRILCMCARRNTRQSSQVTCPTELSPQMSRERRAARRTQGLVLVVQHASRAAAAALGGHISRSSLRLDCCAACAPPPPPPPRRESAQPFSSRSLAVERRRFPVALAAPRFSR